MTKVGDIPLGNNAEKKKIKQTDSVHSYINNSDRTEIITIITDDCEVNSQEIAKMLFRQHRTTNCIEHQKVVK